MTGVLLVLIVSLFVGFPLVRLIDRSVTGPALVGAAMLAGFAVVSLELLACSLTAQAWSRAAVLVPLGVIGVGLWSVAWMSGRVAFPSRPELGVATAIDLVTAVVVFGHGYFATLAPTPENDFMTIWGLKAKTFWIAGGIDFDFLTSQWSLLFHVDYPILVPMLYDAIAVVNGRWSEAPLGAVTTLFGVAALLVVRGESRRETGSAIPAALITLGMSGLLLSPWIGLADGGLAACLISAVLLIRRGLLAEKPATIRAGALLAGSAALTKNEGLALVAVITVALLIASWRVRSAVDLWPALVIPAPWLFVRWAYDLSTDLGREGVLLRIVERLGEPGILGTAMVGTWVGRPLLWIGVLLGIALAASPLVRRERFAISVVVLQVLAYLLAYMSSPHDLSWHVTWSWERLVSHVTPLVVFVVSVHLVVGLGEMVEMEPSE